MSLKKGAVLAVIAAFAAIQGAVFAYELKEMTPEAAEIVRRQKERGPIVDRFREAGWAGENSAGYLEIRGEPGTVKRTVEEENADRGKLYGLIAAQHRVGIGAVESAAAEKIRRSARRGTLIQQPAGKWERR